MKNLCLTTKHFRLTIQTLAILAGLVGASARAASFDEAIDLAKVGQSSKALAVLQKVEDEKSVNQNLVNLTRGRIYFQMNKLDDAYASYEKVAKSSDYWLEAVEEKAHVMGRKGEYAKVIGLIQTTFADNFADLVGPEPYFVSALTHLKICNYSEIFKVTELFKKRFSEKAKVLTQLVAQQRSPALDALINKTRKAKLSYATIGALAKELPRRLSVDQAARLNEKQLVRRTLELAREELKEIESTANKLQIIEAEVIQRIHLASGENQKRTKMGKIAKGRDVLRFPMTDEVWLDELDNYSAEVEKCPAPTRRASL